MLGARFKDRTFATFRPSNGNTEALNRALDIVAGQFREGCAFWSNTCGNGKTHLAAAIVHAAIEADRSAIMVTGENLMRQIRSGYNDGSDKELSERMVVNRHAHVDVLVIDDIGTEEVSPWSARMMYGIVNARYEAGHPIILTSNMSAMQLYDAYTAPRDKSGRVLAGYDRRLGEKLVSRIGELTSQSWVEITDEDQRWRG
jgi:DNA replication protein DnaC